MSYRTSNKDESSKTHLSFLSPRNRISHTDEDCISETRIESMTKIKSNENDLSNECICVSEDNSEQYHQSLDERMDENCWFCGKPVDPDEIAGCCMNWDFATYHLKCGEKVASDAWKCPVCIGEGLSETYHVYHVNDSDNELAMQLDMSHSRICHVCLNGCCHDFRYVWEKKPAQWEFGLVPVCLGCFEDYPVRFEDYESETKCSGCGIELHTEHEKDEACCNSCNYPEESE